MTKRVSTKKVAKKRVAFGSTHRWGERVSSLDTLGMIGAWVGYCIALSPSLLPHPPFFLAIEIIIGTAIGYSFGRVIARLIGRYLSLRLSPLQRRLVWAGLVVLSVVATIVAVQWHNELSDVVGMPRLTTVAFVKAYGTALVVLGVMWLAVVALRQFFTRVLQRYGWVRRTGWVFLTGGVIALLLGIQSGDIANVLYAFYQNSYAAAQARTDAGVVPTNDSLRSGSSASLVTWQSLGRQGRNFIGSGPSAAMISRTIERPATSPIRVYIGVDAAASAAERAELAVRELERTGAFNRKLLVVLTPSGSGWVEPELVDSVEYIYGGDTAIVTTQYSYVPSWVVSTCKQDLSTDSGKELFDAVYARWSSLPIDTRPKLYVSGLSLGSYGMQAAFRDIADVRQKTDGALFAGTPSFTPLWQSAVAERLGGSSIVLPKAPAHSGVYFASTRQDFTKQTHRAEVVYTQHGSDPTVWWNPKMLFRSPQWLSEERTPDRSPHMGWLPAVSFTKVTLDQFLGLSPAKGFGHNYQNTHTRAWLALGLPSPDWSEANTQSVEQALGITQTAP